MRAAVAALLVACASTPATGTHTAALSTAPGCFDPVAYGAVPGDTVADRVAFQLAIDAAAAEPDGGTLCVPPGRWTLGRAPLGSYNRYAALSTHGRDVTIAGVGAESILELVGDQGKAATTMISIDPSAQGITVRDLTIRTADATNTDEQTHAIATSGVCSGATCQPIRDVEVHHVRFAHQSRGERKGDCVRLIGNDTVTELSGVRIHDNTGDCARSFVEIQRGVNRVVIANNNIHCTTCDQDIDGEASGVVNGVGAPTDIVIAGNTFEDGANTQGDYSISLTSVRGATITGNTLPRGIFLYRTTGVVLANNVITANMRGPTAVIDASNTCSGLTISHNPTTRSGAPGPLIRLTPHSGAACTDVTIDHNSMVQNTAGPGIYMESVSSATIDHNAMTWTVPAPGFGAIYERATIGPVDHLMVTENRIYGPVTYGFILSASPHSFGGDVKMIGNTATDVTFGSYCSGAGGFAPITSYGNTLGPRICGDVKFQEGQ